MTHQHIGFLHPGLMGESLAATAKNSGKKFIGYQITEVTPLEKEL